MDVVFYIFTITSFYIDYIFWRNITPNIVAFMGIFLISILYDLFGKGLGFVDVESDVYLYLILFVFSGQMASFLGFYISQKIKFNYKVEPDVKRKFTYSKAGVRFFFIFITFVIGLCLFGIYRAYMLTNSLSGDEFEGLLSHGIIAHVFALLMASTPFIYIIASQGQKINKLYYILLVCVILLLFMKQIKYWVLVPLVWILLLNIYLYNQNSVSKILKNSLIIFSLMFLFFIGAYFFVIILNSGDYDSLDLYSSFIGIFNHLLGYLFSGILVFSSLIRDGVFNDLVWRDSFVVFNGVVNVVSTLVGEGLYKGDEFLIPFYVLNEDTGQTGNVGTLWATFLLYLGNFSFFVFFIIIFFLSLLFSLSKHFGLALIIYTSLVAFMFFSWFASYFALLTIYEVPILASLIYIGLYPFRLKTSFTP